ncbi:adhesion G protein-coupled receptor E1-like isoform X2 [Liolophura sinensis]|uniref:adhesion G protein-coupled receptor E1-like isoform X2 n=1 Tax=Liolophura sinensis TaxID=3198878 RepID=UPI00315990C6
MSDRIQVYYNKVRNPFALLQTCGNEGDECPDNTTCIWLAFTMGPKENVCDCSYGARKADSGQCLDIDECTENQIICGNNSVCTNTLGDYTCACAEGYRQRKADEVGCNLDIDECIENQTICGNNSVCTNMVGNYTCACAEGYMQRNGEEVGCSLDIDECTGNPEICGNNSVCTNTEGSYMCACAEGYRQREDEELGCIRTSTVSPAGDSSALTVGLAVGIGGVVPLVLVVLAVIVFRARNRSRGDGREDIGLERQGKH